MEQDVIEITFAGPGLSIVRPIPPRFALLLSAKGRTVYDCVSLFPAARKKRDEACEGLEAVTETGASNAGHAKFVAQKTGPPETTRGFHLVGDAATALCVSAFDAR